MKNICAALTACWLGAVCAQAMPVDDPVLAELRDGIERGYNQRDIQTIEAAREAILRIGENPADNAALRDLTIYLGAYARLRQSLLVAEEKNQARSYLEDCITALETLLERRSDDARARALLGSCYGASSRYYFLGAAWRGLEAGRQISAAIEQAPDDAWVVFQDGVSDYEKPMMFGGSKKRALDKLQRAARLFAESRPAGSVDPVWGEAETWLYIGRTHQALGENEAARKALQTGLAMAPDNRGIREALQTLP